MEKTASMGRGRWMVCLLIALLLGAALPAGADAPASVLRALDVLQLGEPQSYGSLTVIPLLGLQVLDPTRFATLEQALEKGWLEIVEKDGGTVPEVLITNRSDRTIFVMGGEILSGARQDRIIRHDLLIGPWRKRLAVPVFCVEEGRWHYTSKSFGSEKNLGTYKLRAEAQALDPEGQAKVWNEVARSNERMGIASSTGAYQDAYRDAKVLDRILDLEQALLGLPKRYQNAIGVLVGIGGRIVSLDLFASPYLFQELWPKILKSSALALARDEEKARVSSKQAAELLRRLRRLDYKAQEALDLGIGFSVSGEGLSAQVLVYRESLLHLAAFTFEPEEDVSRRGVRAVQEPNALQQVQTSLQRPAR